jgi:hypothetical protein
MCQGAIYLNRQHPRCARACLGGTCGAVVGGAGGYYAGSSLGAGIGCPLGTATGIIGAELMGGGRCVNCRSSHMMQRVREMYDRFSHPSVLPAPVTLTNPLAMAAAIGSDKESGGGAGVMALPNAGGSGGAGGGGGGGGGGRYVLDSRNKRWLVVVGSNGEVVYRRGGRHDRTTLP